MTQSASLVRFLAECWRADRVRSEVLDLFVTRIERLRVFERDPFLGFAALRVDLPADDPLVVAASVSRREKQACLFAFAVVGAARLADRERIAAPLLVWPARVEVAGDRAQLVAESSTPQINGAALAALVGQEADAEALAAALSERLPALPWGDGGPFALAAALGELVPGLDGGALERFPEQLTTLEELRSTRSDSPADGSAVALPAIGAFLTVRSLESRGVDDELRLLADAPRFSPPVARLLGAVGAAAPDRVHHARRRSPAVLSHAQDRALAAAAEHDLALLVGPPGTGKSFTIAAIALDAIGRGESVLLASGREQAIAVVEEKLRVLAGGWLVAVRAGRGESLAALRTTLEDLLQGDLASFGPPPRATSRTLGRGLVRRERRRERLERRLAATLALESSLGRRADGSWLEGLGQRFAAWRLARRDPVWELFADYEAELAALGPAVAEWLRVVRRERVSAALERRRSSLEALRRALRARRSGDQERWMANVDRGVLHDAFPLWSTTFADVHRAIPFEPELFDLVIVDEATQCDMATALPVLQRGRRALVAGDPRQLRHVSFLAEVARAELAERCQVDPERAERFDYRSRSLLDLVGAQVPSGRAVVRLDEHFRSAPAIIEFSNREFYRGGLAVMTRRPETLRRPAFELRRVEGERDAAGVNQTEVDATLEALLEQLARAPPGTAPRSIGVLSPFRAQTDALVAAIAGRLDATLVERHRLLVSTAWGFQGEERDTMILSLAVGPQTPSGAVRYLLRDDVFNVAVTRARSLQVVVTSLGRGQEPPGSLLQRYLAHVEREAVEPAAEALAGDPFAAAVTAGCEARGCRVWPRFEVAGTVVDLLLERGGASLAIDLLGAGAESAPALELERARMLRRAGLELFPLPWSRWKSEPERVLEAIAGRLEGRASAAR